MPAQHNGGAHKPFLSKAYSTTCVARSWSGVFENPKLRCEVIQAQFVPLLLAHARRISTLNLCVKMSLENNLHPGNPGKKISLYASKYSNSNDKDREGQL